MTTSPSPSHEPSPLPGSTVSGASNRVTLDPVRDRQLIADLDEAIAEGGPGRPWSEIRSEVLQ